MVTIQEQAVLAVIAYSAQFDHPLTMQEIWLRLLTRSGLSVVNPKLKLPTLFKLAALKHILNSLVKSKKIVKKHQFYTLISHPQSFQKRQVAQQIAQEKAAVVDEFVRLVEVVPWVLGVTITGSHAVAGVSSDDVDFLVITQKNRLWLTRLWLLFQSAKRGRRPLLPDGDLSHSWDLNFWLTEERLALPVQKQTVYEAYEILQARWVFERHYLRQRFLRANPWVGEYLLNWQLPKAETKKVKLDNNFFLTTADWLAMLVQVGWRTLRHGRQRADRQSAFFHPAKTRQKIFNNWRLLYKKAIQS